MRKVTFAVLAMAALLVGCTSVECSMNNIVASQYCFMDHVENGNDTAIKVTEYYLTVSTKKTVKMVDTVLINKKTDITTLQLPVSYNQKEDILYFDFQRLDQDSIYETVAVDTVCITKTNEMIFEGVECNPRYHHEVLSATTTHKLIDSIVINNNYIDNDPNKVHFSLYLHPSK